MMKNRLLALLLIVALLATAGIALGEGVEIVEDGDGLEVEMIDLSDSLLLDEQPQEEAQEESLASNAIEGDVLPERWEGVYYPTVKTPDNDALFAGYVDGLFGKARVWGNGYAGDQLKGIAKKMFDYLAARVEEVAAGKLSDTYFSFPASVVSSSSLEEAMDNLSLVIDVLLADYPYEMFWCDKTAGIPYGYNGNGAYIGLPVAVEYASDSFVTKSATIKTAQTAAQNARKVVKKYADLSDYEKVQAYLTYICGATSYNDDALGGNTSYGNPWQLIWVFDGDSSTNVVCEGYAKAFQYLCDLSDFQNDVLCITVSGYMNGANHMWNILRMEDGNNYLADPTNSDAGTVGSDGSLFLKGYASVNGNTYGYACAGGSYTISYTYSGESLGVFPAKALKLSKKDYTPSAVKPTATPTPAPTAAPGAKVTGVTIKQGKSATLYMGNKLTLKATVQPAGAKATLTWSSNKTSVATVSNKGVVTPKKKGTAKITVKEAGGKKATITIKVVDVSTVKIAEGKKAALKKGKKLTLHATVSPEQVKTKLTWKSSDTKVATVSSKGVVKAKKAGTAKITVTTANGKKATITITVSK